VLGSAHIKTYQGHACKEWGAYKEEESMIVMVEPPFNEERVESIGNKD